MTASKLVTGKELKPHLKNIFSKYILDDQTFKVQLAQPISLLSYRRYDLIAKYLYAKYRIQGIESDYAKRLYSSHIKSFNNYVENDESLKVGETSFFETYDSLIDNLSLNGFSDQHPVPIDPMSTTLDGAHRIGASLALHKELYTVNLGIDAPCYDYQFFRDRGMPNQFLDSMALEYASLKPDTKLVILWPTAEGKQAEVEDILRRYGDIVYFNEVMLGQSGAINFTYAAYKDEPWVGTEKDGYLGATNKANWCFQNKAPVRVFLFESTQNLVEMKEKIRNLFRVEKHSIHINDTHRETLELSRYLFNSNSVDFLNAKVCRHFSWFQRLFEHYKLWLTNQGYDESQFCIDGSSVLAAYGIRDVRDLDFLHSSFPAPYTGYKEISSHNNNFMHNGLTIDDVIHDPFNHFYYDGHKFISSKLILTYKEQRGEEKDKEDVKSLSCLLSGKPNAEPLRNKLKKTLSLRFWKARVKLLALKLRYYFVKIRIGIK